ncbi:hypothetical protein EDF31_101624 [Curtobacterium sp. PhB142]|uniref:hypothetical protein n=1 Tax=unclassified Curtobacterium TaxID=257496 RepID=UPI001049A3DE|nr:MULTISPECIES: hypothetical protein [unclassified Curtobacterium]TCL88777.1 hypothetical protein EDF31_101624 [Curtobacterium sp. PhB142]
MEEDFVPTDPRVRVRTRVDDELLELFPGLTERPVADLARAHRLAQVVDHRVLKRHGFGILNVLHVAFRYADWVVSEIAPMWPADEDVSIGDPLAVTSEEIGAARKVVGARPAITMDERDLLALEWMTTSAARAEFSTEGISGFGRFLRYRVGSNPARERWLPPAFVPEIVMEAVHQLVEEARRSEESAADLRADFVRQTLRALLRFNDAVHGPAESQWSLPQGRPDEITWLVPFSRRSMLAVQVVTVTGSSPIPEKWAVERLAEKAREATPIKARFVGGATATLPEGTEVVPLVVVAATTHVVAMQRNGCATVALEDLTWIAETAEDDDDLLAFARDLADPDFPRSMGWEAINYWEPWRTNGKQFFGGGIKPSFAMFEAHAGEAEWERAAALSKLEAALFFVGLPPLRETQLAEATADSMMVILPPEPTYDERHGAHRTRMAEGWALSSTKPPVALPLATDEWKSGPGLVVKRDYAGGVAFGLHTIADQWAAAHAESVVSGYRLEFEDADEGEPVSDRSAELHVHGVVRATWSICTDEFVKRANGDPRAANEFTAAPLRSLLEVGGMDESVANQIAQALAAAPPFLILEIRTTRTMKNDLPAPIRLDDNAAAQITRELARRLADSAIDPGTYRGSDANRIIREHLAPAALAELRTRVSECGRTRVVEFGLEQLVRVVDDRHRSTGNLQRVSRHLRTSWDPTEQMVEASGTSLRLRQANEILVEAAIREADDDEVPVSPIGAESWRRLLAAADAYLRLTSHSERLHNGITPVVLEVTDLYELHVRDDDTGLHARWPLDAASLNYAAAVSALDESTPIETVASPEVLMEVDAAMLDAFGVTRQDIYAVLGALVQWAEFEAGSNIAKTDRAAVVAWLSEVLDEADPGRETRLQTALELLSTDESTLSESWEPWRTRTRRNRLLVQPIVRHAGAILIAPQFLEASLSVYFNYFSQGMLPWSARPPKRLETALANLRSERNRHLEQAVDEALRSRGFTTITRVKPGDGKRLGVPTLTTEIDIVAGKPDGDIIWLIEAKDPASVHGIPETARQLKAFYDDSESPRRGSPSYTTQLGRKDNELRPFARAIAGQLGMRTEAEPELRTTFVTRSLTPAEYITGRFPVVTVDELLRLLDVDGDV